MLALLRPHTRSLIATQEPDGSSLPAASVASTARSMGFRDAQPISEPLAALATARRLATSNDIVVCTGRRLDGVRPALHEENGA